MVVDLKTDNSVFYLAFVLKGFYVRGSCMFVGVGCETENTIKPRQPSLILYLEKAEVIHTCIL